MKKTLKTLKLRKKKRTHGFRARSAKGPGKQVLRRRRRKGRHQLIP